MDFLQNIQTILSGQEGGLGNLLGTVLGGQQNAGQGGGLGNLLGTVLGGQQNAGQDLRAGETTQTSPESSLGDLVGSMLGGQDKGTGGPADISGAVAGGQGEGALGGLLGPAALGGLAAILFSGKAGRKVAGNALLMGGGATLLSTLWKKYKNVIPQLTGATQAVAASSSPEDRAVRLVKAMIFAAKSDGHIDEVENAAIRDTISRLQLGQDLQNVIEEALNQELDPAILAQGVQTPEEALEVYMVSCSVITADSIMETAYLEALAKQLGIPEEVTRSIAGDIKANA